MSAANATPFAGFSQEAIQFLVDLAANNDRAWFNPRKADYERLLKEPLEAFVIALGEQLAARGVPLRADPARAPFRIYRDVRFSKDKSPYKTNVGASFPWMEGTGGVDRHGVGGYFHFQPGEIFIGGGMWHPEPARLGAFRTRVVEEPEAVHAAIDEPSFVQRFGRVRGDELRRVPSGFPADHPDADLLRLKDVWFGSSLTDAEALSPGLPALVAGAFQTAVPVLRLLAALG